VALAEVNRVTKGATMIVSDVLFIGGLIFVLWGLHTIADQLKAIRTILADIANATRTTSAGLQTSAEARETNRLLKLAIKKQWGSAIDLGDERPVNPSTPVIAPPSPDAPLGVWLAYRADLQPLADLPGITTFVNEADAAIARLRPSPDRGGAAPGDGCDRRGDRQVGNLTAKPPQLLAVALVQDARGDHPEHDRRG
jgi:hypothetical protein